MAIVAKPENKRLRNRYQSTDKGECSAVSPSPESKMIHRIDAESLAAWVVPPSVLSAEEQFEQLLPTLLPEHENRWVFVAYDSTCKVFDSFDDADLGAEGSGYSTSQYVVRQVSLSELTE